MKSGIYQIRHLASGKVYIGSSVDIGRRWTQHRGRLRKGTHHSPLLQRAWDKYGPAAFVFEVLERVASEELIARENAHMRNAVAIYNFAPAGGTTLGVKLGPMPDWHRAKVSAAHMGKVISPEHREALRIGCLNRPKPSAEARANMSKAQTGRKMAPLTPEHRAIVSATHKGKTISDEHKRRLSEAHTGRVQSAEIRAKRSASVKASWVLRKHGHVASMPLGFTEVPVIDD